MSVQKIVMAAAGSSSPYYIVQAPSTENSGGTGIAKDSSGNYYVVGYDYYPTLNEGNALLLKYTSTGSLVWQKTLNTSNGTGYGATDHATSYCIAIDGSDNIYIAGSADQNNPSYYYCFLAKYNTSGTLQWQKKYTYMYDWSIGKKIQLDSSGNIYLLVSNSRTNDGFITKFDSTGALITQYRINNLNGSYAWESNAVAVDSSSRVYFAGKLRLSSGDTKPYPIIACWNNAGTLQWQRMLTGFASGEGSYQAMCCDSTGIYVAGRISVTNMLVIVKYDTSGNILWQRQIDIPTSSVSSMKVGADGYIYLTVDFYAGQILKFDSSGNLQWQRRFYTTADSMGGLSDLIIDDTKIVATGSYKYVAYLVLINLPTDGTYVGTYTAPSGYGNYKYEATTYNWSTPTYTNTTSSLGTSLTNTNFTVSAGVLVTGTGTLVSTKTPI